MLVCVVSFLNTFFYILDLAEFFYYRIRTSKYYRQLSKAKKTLLSYIIDNVVVFLSGIDLLSIKTKKVLLFPRDFPFKSFLC